MMSRFATAQLRLMKYALFMGILGGIAPFIGPPHHGLIKGGIGIVVGAMLLGRKLPDALKEMKKATDEMIDNLFDD